MAGEDPMRQAAPEGGSTLFGIEAVQPAERLIRAAAEGHEQRRRNGYIRTRVHLRKLDHNQMLSGGT